MPETRKGLSSAEAAKRLREDGENCLAEEKKTSAAKIFLGQFKDIMVLILLGATVVSVFLGEYYDAATIIIIVLLNALLGFIQEYRTERTLEALKNMTAPTARVYRDGELKTIPAAQLVKGDCVFLEAGDRVPADIALTLAKGVLAEESILTGESAPVSKESGNAGHTDNSLNLPNVLYGGTVITKGTAEGNVIAVGTSSQMGRISGMLTDIDDEETPLQKRLGELGRVIAVICLVICAAVAGAGILRGEPVFDMLMTGITVAIAAIPEGLPATVTIALALAVSRMLRQKALVHRLHSVETLGCASVICTDKTGTVTENRMTVRRIALPYAEYDVTGSSDRTDGEILGANRSDIDEIMKCAVLCSNAYLTDGKNGRKTLCGDPTEAALIVAAEKGGFRRDKLTKEFPRTDEIPFDSETRLMTVECRTSAGKMRFTKGSPEAVIKLCGAYRNEQGKNVPLDIRTERRITAQAEKMSEDALRVLGFCEETPSGDKVFLGLMGMIDPPRPEAKKAVKLCGKAHIRTVMITGDHKKTAAAIAEQAGILRKDGLVFTGDELDKMSDEKLESVIDRAAVFARVSPEHKLRIVRAFKKKGHIVTMTGDGVNDAPAVKEAHIGVAMGITGTDVTKQAADVILLDDNFATLVNAVTQGRAVYANIRKFVRYLLSCNIGEVLTMFLGIVFGTPMVLLPTQILLVNLVTDGLPAVALGVEPPDMSRMEKPPRKPDESFFSDGLMAKIIIRGILIGILSLGSFLAAMHICGDVAAARTAALFTLVISQLMHVFECKSESGNIFTVPYLNNLKLVLAVLTSLIVIAAAIYLPALQAVFSTVALSRELLLTAFGFAAAAPLLQSVFSLFEKSE